MGAVVVKGGAILSTAPNLPSQVSGIEIASKHAEERAITKGYDYSGATIFIARKGGGMSRPCARCIKTLQEVGVSYVVYADWDKSLIKEKVSGLVATNLFFLRSV
jgi:pyrimidine deaminase RibD-like protein